MTSSYDYSNIAYPKEIVEDCAEALGINLTKEGASLLAVDVEYRLKELIQESAKFMFHSKRSCLTMDDINLALRLKRVEPVYGYTPSDELDFLQVTESSQELFYKNDQVVSFESILNSSLPPFFPEVTYKAEWLSTGQNTKELGHTPIDFAASHNFNSSLKRKTSQVTWPDSSIYRNMQIASSTNEITRSDIELPESLEKFKEQVLSVVFEMDDSYRNEVFDSLRIHPNVQPLLSHFIRFIQEEMYQSIKDVRKLFAILKFIDVLLSNTHFDFSEQPRETSPKKKSKTNESHFQKLIFPLLSCLLSKSLDTKNEVTEKLSWDVRQRAGELFKRLRLKYKSLFKPYIPKLYRTLKDFLSKPIKSLDSLYGFVLCVEVLSPEHLAKLVENNLEIIGKSIQSFNRYEIGSRRVLSTIVDVLSKAAISYSKKNPQPQVNSLSQDELIERCSCQLLSNALIESPDIQCILNLFGLAQKSRCV